MLIKRVLSVIEVSILNVSGADTKLQWGDRLNGVSLCGECIKTELYHISRINIKPISLLVRGLNYQLCKGNQQKNVMI